MTIPPNEATEPPGHPPPFASLHSPIRHNIHETFHHSIVQLLTQHQSGYLGESPSSAFSSFRLHHSCWLGACLPTCSTLDCRAKMPPPFSIGDGYKRSPRHTLALGHSRHAHTTDGPSSSFATCNHSGYMCVDDKMVFQTSHSSSCHQTRALQRSHMLWARASAFCTLFVHP
jgi:hypothetical protein